MSIYSLNVSIDKMASLYLPVYIRIDFKIYFTFKREFLNFIICYFSIAGLL